MCSDLKLLLLVAVAVVEMVAAVLVVAVMRKAMMMICRAFVLAVDETSTTDLVAADVLEKVEVDEDVLLQGFGHSELLRYHKANRLSEGLALMDVLYIDNCVI